MLRIVRCILRGASLMLEEDPYLLSVDRLLPINGSPGWYYSTHATVTKKHILKIYYPFRDGSEIKTYMEKEVCSGAEGLTPVEMKQFILDRVAFGFTQSSPLHTETEHFVMWNKALGFDLFEAQTRFLEMIQSPISAWGPESFRTACLSLADLDFQGQDMKQVWF